jgi:hypothetical protein
MGTICELSCCNPSSQGIMTCRAAPSTNATMQSPTMGHSGKCRERCTYVIVGHSHTGLLFVPATLSMSHLGSWELSLSVDRLAMGSVKPHVRPLECEACIRPPNKERSCCHAAMPATSVRCKSDCRARLVRLNLLRELFKVPECRRFYHNCDSTALKRGAADGI